jgi:uncharacterized phiE125 gp8 family phage protein
VPLTIVQTVAPAEEPVTTAEAKAHCRVDHDDEDTLIASLIVAARQWCESWTGRQFVTATWRLSLDGFPGCAIRLPKPPLQSVSSVAYDAADGTATTLGSSAYRTDADSEPGRLTPAYGLTWPTARCQTNAVRVTYVAGYGAASAVPKAVKQAILLLVGHWYANREAVGSGGVASEIAMTAQALLTPFWTGQHGWEQ